MLFDIEFIVFVSVSLIAFILTMLIVYLVFGRGVALKLAFVVAGGSWAAVAGLLIVFKWVFTGLNSRWWYLWRCFTR